MKARKFKKDKTVLSKNILAHRIFSLRDKGYNKDNENQIIWLDKDFELIK